MRNVINRKLYTTDYQKENFDICSIFIPHTQCELWRNKFLRKQVPGFMTSRDTCWKQHSPLLLLIIAILMIRGMLHFSYVYKQNSIYYSSFAHLFNWYSSFPKKNYMVNRLCVFRATLQDNGWVSSFPLSVEELFLSFICIISSSQNCFCATPWVLSSPQISHFSW